MLRSLEELQFAKSMVDSLEIYMDPQRKVELAQTLAGAGSALASTQIQAVRETLVYGG